MTWKHASAYTYGAGFGSIMTASLLGKPSVLVTLAAFLIFSLAYWMDKRAEADGS